VNYEHCTTVTSIKRVVVKEKRSSFELINTSRISVEKIKVDGCLISDNSERCDWLFVIKSCEEFAYFIELKGCDLKKAISQLESTIISTKDRFKDTSKKCYVVTSRVPKQGPSVQRFVREFYRKYSIVLVIKNIRATVDIH
jgi:hypothetical protein